MYRQNFCQENLLFFSSGKHASISTITHFWKIKLKKRLLPLRYKILCIAGLKNFKKIFVGFLFYLKGFLKAIFSATHFRSHPTNYIFQVNIVFLWRKNIPPNKFMVSKCSDTTIHKKAVQHLIIKVSTIDTVVKCICPYTGCIMTLAIASFTEK